MPKFIFWTAMDETVGYGLKLLDMTETLQLLLTDPVPPEGHIFGLPITSMVLRIGEKLHSLRRLLELAEMLRVVFSASRTPADLAKRMNDDGQLATLMGAITSCGDLEVRHIGLDINRLTLIDDWDSSKPSPARSSTQDLAIAHPPATPLANPSRRTRKRREQDSSEQDMERRPNKTARRD
jgi:hypothetical protein